MGGSSSSLFFLLIMAALLVFMFSRTRKQQKAQQEMQNNVTVGAEVMTSSGMFGKVVEKTDEYVLLEIAPGLQTRWTPRAVARVVAPAAAVTPLVEDDAVVDLTKRPAGSTEPTTSPTLEDTRGDDAAGGAARSQ